MFLIFLSLVSSGEVKEEYTKASRVDGGLFTWPNALTMWKSVLNDKKILWDPSSNDIIKTDDIDFREVIKRIATNFTGTNFDLNRTICVKIAEMNLTKEACPVSKTDTKNWVETQNDKYFLDLLSMDGKAIPGYTVTETNQLLSQVFAYAAMVIPFVVFFAICFIYYCLYCFSCCCCCNCCCCKAKDRRRPNIVLAILMIISTALIFISAMFYMASVGKIGDTVQYIRNLPDNLNIYFDQLIYGADKLVADGIPYLNNTVLNVFGSILTFTDHLTNIFSDLSNEINTVIDNDIKGTSSGSLYSMINELNQDIRQAKDQNPGIDNKFKIVDKSKIDTKIGAIKSNLSKIDSIVEQITPISGNITNIQNNFTGIIDNLTRDLKTEELRKALDDAFLNNLNETWSDYEVQAVVDKVWSSLRAIYIFPGFILLVLFIQFLWSFFTHCCCSRCTACCAPCCPCLCNCSCMVCGIIFTALAFLILLLAELMFVAVEYSIGDVIGLVLPNKIHIPPIDLNNLIAEKIPGAEIHIDPLIITDIPLAPENLPIATTFFDAKWDVGFVNMFLINKILPLGSFYKPIEESLDQIIPHISKGVNDFLDSFIDDFKQTIDDQKESISTIIPNITETDFPDDFNDTALQAKILKDINNIEKKIDRELDNIKSTFNNVQTKAKKLIDNDLKSFILILIELITHKLFEILNKVPGFVIKEPINLIRRYILYNFTYAIVVLSICAFFAMVSLFFTLVFMCIRRPGLGKYSKHTGKTEFTYSSGTSYTTSSYSGKKRRKKDKSYSDSSSERVITVKFVSKKDLNKGSKSSSTSASSSSAGIAKSATGKNKNFATSSSSHSSSSGYSDGENAKSTYM